MERRRARHSGKDYARLATRLNGGDAMLGGAPGTAATVAAASILVAEGGTVALVWGAACYALLSALWVTADVARAWWSLRGRLPIVPWRPNLLFRVYPVSKRNLLDRVSRRMDAPADSNPTPEKKKGRPRRAFGAVVGTCPFAHVGSAALANAVLKNQPRKAPLYDAFRRFAGDGIFTAEGDEWSTRRAEVLEAFAAAGLEPLAAASKKVAVRLAKEIDDTLLERSNADSASTTRGGDASNVVVDMLPALQRATLRATFEYLTGCTVAEAAAESAASSIYPEYASDARAGGAAKTAGYVDAKLGEVQTKIDPEALEDEYLRAATTLRHVIPARARSVWMLSDLCYYAFSAVGRSEKESIRKARRLPTLGLRAAKPGSPFFSLARGEAHGGASRGTASDEGCEPFFRKRKQKASFWESYMGFGVFASTESRFGASVKPPRIPKPLLDEAVTLLFAGHDTQSATLSWCLLRLAKEGAELQDATRAGLLANVDVASQFGMADLLSETHRASAVGDTASPVNTTTQPAWRTSSAAPELEAVLRETLRLHPVAPLVVRRLVSDAAGDDVTLPEGSAVGVWLHAVHRDPEAWDRPDAFVPDRWLIDGPVGEGNGDRDGSRENENEKIKDKKSVRRKGAAFMPFATGPRACVGQHLAWVFMRITLARLVCAYEFAPENETDAMIPSVGFTVTPANAARVRVRKR